MMLLTALLLLAQTEIERTTDWFGPISNLSATAIMGVVFWHVMTRGIPQIIERFTADMKEARGEHANEMKETRADYRASLTQVVEHCRQESELMRQMFNVVAGRQQT